MTNNMVCLVKDFTKQLKKIKNTWDASQYEILTPDGWESAVNLHQTEDYLVWNVHTHNGFKLSCADKHIIIDADNKEIFVENLSIGDRIQTENGIGIVIKCEKTEKVVPMYDFELSENSNRVYYTNGILSHNTHLAKTLANLVFDGEENIIRVDMSEYMEKFSISRLIGAPPGYVGYEEGGQLTEKVRRKPYSVILLDEIEKAHPDIFNILLQVLDEGHVTDGLGRRIDFSNCIIIMTTNAGARELSAFGSGVGFGSKTDVEYTQIKATLENALKKAFRPEFLNRVDDIIVFHPLEQESMSKIVRLQVKEACERIKNIGYNVIVDENVYEFLVKEGFDKQYGARPLKRAVQRHIEDTISEFLLEDNSILELKVSLNETGEKIIITENSPKKKRASKQK